MVNRHVTRQVYAANNQKPLRLLLLQAYGETEDYFRFMGTPAQADQDLFRSRRAAFYSRLKSITALASALRVNMNTDSCLIASHVASRHPSTSHVPSLLISSLSVQSFTIIKKNVKHINLSLFQLFLAKKLIFIISAVCLVQLDE